MGDTARKLTKRFHALGLDELLAAAAELLTDLGPCAGVVNGADELRRGERGGRQDILNTQLNQLGVGAASRAGENNNWNIRYGEAECLDHLQGMLSRVQQPQQDAVKVMLSGGIEAFGSGSACDEDAVFLDDLLNDNTIDSGILDEENLELG
jgi:hypothetical protein